MTTPHRPIFVKQLDGSPLGGLNCTMAATAMAIDRATLGATRTTGAECRRRSGDTSGGTNLAQARTVAASFGVELAVHQPLAWTTIDAWLHAGRGCVAQGNSSATINTPYSASETFRGNHAWWINEGRGWAAGADGLLRPTEYLVFDPLADGRRAGIAASPMWMPRDLVHAWTSGLTLSTGTVGPGRAWVGFVRDTEPHAHLRFSAARTTPLPDLVVTHNVDPTRRINVRNAPTLTATVMQQLPVGSRWEAWQVTDAGQVVAGSGRWFGNHQGDRWIHSSGLTAVGGID